MRIKEESEQTAKMHEQSSLKLKELAEDMVRVKKTLGKLEGRENEKCFTSRLVEHKLEKYRGEQDSRMVALFETIQEIGTLQRKMISAPKEASTFPDEDSVLPASYLPSRQMKILKGGSLGRKQTCESTNISYSRNTETR
jgi:hypothetical protein